MTEGRLIVRVGDETVTAGPGEVVHMPAGVPGVFEIDEDMEAVCVHYPTDAKAGREWDGAERMPPESDIRLVSSDVVWVTDRAPRVDAMAVLPTADRGAIGQWLDDRTDVFAYLNNDVDAHAVTDAQWLRDHVQ